MFHRGTDVTAWCPPAPSPPGCFSPPDVAFSPVPPACPSRGEFWWDGRVLHMFDGVVWVSIGPFTGAPVMGVTDGSVAGPGFVGEVIEGGASGTLNVIPPPGAPATAFTALIVPPGDWSIQGTVTVSDLTTGVYWDYITFSLLMGSEVINSAQIVGAFTGPNGLTAGIFSGPLFPLSVSNSVSITGSLIVAAVNGGASGTGSWSFTTIARRMR